MIIGGLDPGLDGAFAIVEGAAWRCFDMPTLSLSRSGKNKREIDSHALANLIGQWLTPNDHAFVERAGAMPGQGVSSMFAIGKGYGIIIGVLSALAIPYTIIEARVWKRALHVPAEKDGARARASQLIPAAAVNWPLKKHDGRAEAALIALYGSQHIALAAAA